MPDAPWTGGFQPGADRFAVDGDHTLALAVGSPIISFPFDSDSTAPDIPTVTLVTTPDNPSGFKYVLEYPYNVSELSHISYENFIIEQDFTIAADHFSPLLLNTPYDRWSYAPDYAGILDLERAILVSESQPQDVGNGVVMWRRTYATVPKSRSSYEDITFSFPGIAPTIVGTPTFDTSTLIPTVGVMPVTLNNGSQSYQVDVYCRVQHDFFLVPVGTFAIWSGPDNRFDPAYQIPQFRVFFGRYINETNQVVSSDWVGAFDFANIDGTAETAPALTSVPPPNTGDGSPGDYGIGYNQMVGAAEICVRASVFRPWRGNIMERITYFTVAK